MILYQITCNVDTTYPEGPAMEAGPFGGDMPEAILAVPSVGYYPSGI